MTESPTWDSRQRSEEMRSEETERWRAQLRQARRLESLGQLAGGIAHDFNNILIAILSYVSVVRRELAEADESDWLIRLGSADSDLAQITQAAEWATSLTRQVVAFARQDAIRPQVLDLNAIVTAATEMLRRTLCENIDVVTSLDDHLWPVLADPGQLGQVLLNLAVNARDAMPAGGTLTIDTSNSAVDADSIADGSASAPGRYVQLRVSDTGVGMSPEEVEHVFEPFFTARKEGAGTGLGLATTYRIIAQSEGQVKVESEPGTGTTFSIMLPVSTEAAITRSKPMVDRRRRVSAAVIHPARTGDRVRLLRPT
ncbi:MAG TPA: ATP-binding protein [Streptosporangiaceae bacterium]|nr:ATP-binding protein [Streptosporangiaceae bacterium]